MKNNIIFAMLLILLSFNFSQAYDSSWFRSNGWSGEYPPGFQVYKRGIKVMGRTSVNATEIPSVECVLKRNRYSPGRVLPKADYVEMSKIVPMTANSDFEYTTYKFNKITDTYDETIISFRTGDVIEYLAYLSEGYFIARHNGVEFEAGQQIFDNIDIPESYDNGSLFLADQWIYLSCVNNVSVWLMLSDLQISIEQDLWIDGVRSYFHEYYY